MNMPKIPRKIIAKAKSITGKRSRVVIDHLLKHQTITTEDIENYGYKHPPRAIRDVREQGLPLEMFWTTSSEGHKIAGYRFGDQKKIKHDRVGGRKVFSKVFRTSVIDAHGSRCAICVTGFEDRYFQLDHCIPYEVAGDIAANKRQVDDYMPLCASCNRAKSWSCEHCHNWLTEHDEAVCARCHWASPKDYDHIAGRDIRRLEVIWEEEEVAEFQDAAAEAEEMEQPLPEFVKLVLRRHLARRK